MLINKWLNKENVVSAYKRILLSYTEGKLWDICRKMDTSRKYNVEWNIVFRHINLNTAWYHSAEQGTYKENNNR